MSANMALLVIDVQVGLVDSDGEQPAHQGEQMLENINRLLVAARSTGTPVIYIQHDGDAGGRLEAGSPGWAIHRLSRRPRVSGMRTEMCVDTTCRRAISEGYDVTLVADAHATVDSEVLPAAQIIAHHNYTLDGFGTDAHEIAVRLASEVSF